MSTPPEPAAPQAGFIISKLMLPIHARFEPQPDITAYELARVLPYLHWHVLNETDWETLGSANRHLKRIP